MFNSAALFVSPLLNSVRYAGACAGMLVSVYLAAFPGWRVYKDRLGYVFDASPRTLVYFLSFFYYSSMFLARLLVDICVYERTVLAYRHVVSYVVSSADYSNQFRFRTAVGTVNRVPTVTLLFSNASWAERESFELFGVWFEGHRDCRRVVTDYGYDGFVGRREFPVIGVGETFYSVFYGGVIHGALGGSVSSGKVHLPGNLVL